MSRLQIDGRLPVEYVGADHEVDMRNRVAHKVRLGDKHRYHGQRRYGLQRWREGKRVYSRDMPLYNPLQVSFTGYIDSRMMVFVLNLLGVCRSTWLMFLPHITKVTKLSTIVIPIITVSIVSSPGRFN